MVPYQGRACPKTASFEKPTRNFPGPDTDPWTGLTGRGVEAMHRLVESELKDLGALQVTRCGQAELFRFEL